MIVRFLKKHSILPSMAITLLIILIFDLLGWTHDAKYMNLVAFGTGLYIVIFLEIVKGSKLRSKIIRPLGFSFLFCLVLYAELGTRYELQHNFHKPCWSPDGKQIAFFMEKNLIQYRFGLIGGWSPNPLWHKYYLCTMDYNGGDFKQIKQTEQVTDEISWSGSGEIVYTQDIRLNVDIILQRKIMYTSTDGKETGTLYETEKIPTNDVVKENEMILDPWLSKDKRYLGFVLNYREPRPEEEKAKYGYYYENYRLVVKDLKTQQNKIDILQRDVKYGKYTEFYGSYTENKIAYQEDSQIIIRDLEPNEVERIDTKNIMVGLPMRYDVNPMYRSDAYSPDRQMYATGSRVWTKNNKLITDYYIKTRCSYLFNIFPK